MVGGWWAYSEWRMGRVELTTEGEPLLIQVLGENSDTAIGEPFDVVSRHVVKLPAGDYRLRVSGKGRLSRTYRFAVNRGETQSHAISLDEGRLLSGEPAPPKEGEPGVARCRSRLRRSLTAVELTPGKANVIEWTEKSFICRDGATGSVVWDVLDPAAAFRESARSIQALETGYRPLGTGDQPGAGKPVRQNGA